MAQANLQRTIEELNNSDYNYFIACKIDVKENNATKIGDAIETVLRSTSGDIIGRRLIELKNDCMEIMCKDAIYENGAYVPNRGGRAQEAARAVDFKKKEARGIIETLCRTRKTLLKSDILSICDKANKPVSYFAEDEFIQEILPYLTGLGVKIIDNTDTKIPFNDFEKIEKQLDSLNKKDLYDFLEVEKTAYSYTIGSAVDLKYRESVKCCDLRKKQAISTLCSYVKKILQTDPAIRKAYDDYLVLRKDVWEDFAKRRTFGITYMSVDEYKNYVQTVIRLLDATADEAEMLIAIGCRYYQITITGQTEKASRDRFLFCPYCGKKLAMNTNDIFCFCPYCGELL